MRVLGPIEFVDATAQMVPVGKGLLARTFGVLFAAGGRVVQHNDLADGVWGAEAPMSARTQIQGYVSRLRRLLVTIDGVEIQTSGSGYVLELAEGTSDAGQLRRAVADASAPGALESDVVVDRLVAALGLWRGQPFDGADGLDDSPDHPITLETLRLHGLRLDALERLALAHLRAGGAADATRLLELEARAHLERESLVAVLLVALHEEARAIDAATLVHAYEEGLAELGLVTSRRFRELHGRVLADDSPVEHLFTWLGHGRSAGRTAVGPSTAGPAGAGYTGAHAGGEPSAVGSALPPPNVADPVVVGRERELAAIAGGWAAGRIVGSVVGEEGAGKTTLVLSAARAIEATGAVVLLGRCREELGVPYDPLVDALTRADRAGRAGAGELVSLLTDDRWTSTGPGSRRRADLFAGVVSGLARLSGSERTLFVIEDLHWASDDTCRLLHAILADERSSAMSFLLTFRPELGAQHPFHQLWSAAVRLPGYVPFGLTGLGQDAVRDVVASVFALERSEADLDELARAVYERTEGHPLFVRELMNRLVSAPSSTNVRALLDDVPPASAIEAVTARRLTRLSPPATDLVTALACGGARIPFALSARVLAQWSEDELLHALDELQEVGLIGVEDSDEVAFSHQFFRKVVLNRTSGPRRSRLHHAYATQMMEVVTSDPGAIASSEIAMQLHLAGARAAAGQASGWALLASHDANLRSAFAEALIHADLAHAWSPSGSKGHASRARATLARRVALASTGDVAAAKQAAVQASCEAEAAGDAELMTAAALAHAGFALLGAADSESLELLERTREAVAGHPGLVARLEASRASHLALWGGDLQAGVAVGEAALDTAERSGSAMARVEARWALSLCLLGTADVERRLALARELLALGELVADDEVIGAGLRAQIPALLQRGEASMAEASIERAYTHAVSARDWPLQADTARWRAALALARGDHEEAADWIDEQARLGRGLVPYEVSAAGQRFFLALVERRLDDVAAFADAVRRDRVAHRAATAGRALVAAHAGDNRAARELAMESSPFDLPLRPDGRNWITQVGLLAEVADLTNDVELAELLAPRLTQFSGQMAVVSFGEHVLGAADRMLGVCASLLGQGDRAAARFERALVLEDGAGWHACAAQTREAQARAIARG